MMNASLPIIILWLPNRVIPFDDFSKFHYQWDKDTVKTMRPLPDLNDLFYDQCSYDEGAVTK